jgi:hypothetical protein
VLYGGNEMCPVWVGGVESIKSVACFCVLKCAFTCFKAPKS